MSRREILQPQFAPWELPAGVDHSGGLPPVRHQVGSSCVGWAVCYYNRSFDEYCELGWDPSIANHQFSANYVYNQNLLRDRNDVTICEYTDIGEGCGMYAQMAYETLLSQGCCTHQCYPSLDDREPVTTLHREQAKPYRITTYGIATDSHTWREILANGHVLTATIKWYSTCDNPDPQESYIITNSDIGYLRGYHQVCICGYDDNIDNTGIGGFKFVNSHGTGYGDAGFAWLSYEYMDATSGYCGYWMTDTTTPPYNLATVDNYLGWQGPIGVIYEIYDENFNIIESTTNTMYGPVADGTYGVGAIGGDCMETVVVGSCETPQCMFGVG